MGLLGETVRLTHYGRKSGKPYGVTIWFATIDGSTWIGSLNSDRGWVRNVRANGRATLDFGDGPKTMKAWWIDDPRDLERYENAIHERYGLVSRVLGFLIRGKRGAFRLSAV